LCSFQLFARRKPNCNQDWQRKLPDFVKRLEEALYRAARSKVRSCPPSVFMRCVLGRVLGHTARQLAAPVTGGEPSLEPVYSCAASGMMHGPSPRYLR
jgi:hypothetical protein